LGDVWVVKGEKAAVSESSLLGVDWGVVGVLFESEVSVGDEGGVEG
jgi:hypothetical protein